MHMPNQVIYFFTKWQISKCGLPPFSTDPLLLLFCQQINTIHHINISECHRISQMSPKNVG